MKTEFAKKSEIRPSWHLVDAKDKVLGRLASEIARILLGKKDVRFAPGVDLEHFVIVTNAADIAVTGNKLLDKKYYRHSGYKGNLKEQTLEEKLAQKPEDVIRLAVKGMLPSNTHGRQLLSHLKVFAGAEHNHQAQQPVVVEV